MRHTKTTIINAALMHLGAQGVTAGFQHSAPAQAADAAYPAALAAVLASYSWNFATRHKGLALNAEEVPQPWHYAYALPADCARVEFVADESGNQLKHWELSGNNILADVDAVQLRYITSDVKDFPVLVGEALSWKLAVAIAPYMQQGGRIADLVKMYELKLDEAKTEDGQQSRPHIRRESSFLRERNSEGWW